MAIVFLFIAPEKKLAYNIIVFIIPYYISMAIANYEYLEARALKKAALRQKKKKPKMKVSGAGVKQLQRIILNKNK
jgi:hypothetical protein